MMPGGDKEAYKALEPIVSKVAAQVCDFHGPVTACQHKLCGDFSHKLLLNESI